MSKIAHRSIRQQMTDARYEGTDTTGTGFAIVEPAIRLPRVFRRINARHRAQAQRPEFVGLAILTPAVSKQKA